MADLVAEFAEPPVEILTEQRSLEGKSVGVVSTPKPPCWKVYVDGAENKKGSKVGLVLISPEETTIEKSLKLGFRPRTTRPSTKHLSKASKVAKDMVRAHEVRIGPSWMDPIVTFLKDDILPEGKLEAEKIRRNATRFWLFEDHKLYKRSYSGPYLLCVHLEASELLLEELHEGICGSHTGGRSLSHQALTQGY